MKRVLELTPKGLYCPAGDFYIDPSSKVETAVITHAHSDHACRGNRQYICSKKSYYVLKQRVNKSAEILTKEYREPFSLGSAIVSLHPAGHILGSSQVRVEVNGEVWVVSGDYKREVDPTCDAFEVVPCDVFITEATFASPRYVWPSSTTVVNEIAGWWRRNKRQKVTSVIFCYSLGKAQRILGELAPHAKDPIYIDPAIEPYVAHYRATGVSLPLTKSLPIEYRGGELILAPSSAQKSEWFTQLAEYETAFVSGWMIDPHMKRNFHQGFTLSDHADWPALIRTVEETQAKRVYITHGSSRHLIPELKSRGIRAAPLESLGKPDFTPKIQTTLQQFIS